MTLDPKLATRLTKILALTAGGVGEPEQLVGIRKANEAIAAEGTTWAEVFEDAVAAMPNFKREGWHPPKDVSDRLNQEEAARQLDLAEKAARFAAIETDNEIARLREELLRTRALSARRAQLAADKPRALYGLQAWTPEQQFREFDAEREPRRKPRRRRP